MTFATITRRSVLRPATARTKRSSPWCIVLAGGEGGRMIPMVNSWLGENRPKQYCTFVGSRSMFQHTLDRARNIVPENHIVSVIGPGHRKFLSSALSGPLPGAIIEEPRNLGTVPGIFLALAHIIARDPEACVLILPSDQFVHPEQRFVRHAARACELADIHHNHVVLLAAVPDHPEGNYGWIQPGRKSAGGTVKVLGFRERPGLVESCGLLEEGCLWNTMIMAVRAKTLWDLGRQCLPEMINWFDAFLMLLHDIHTGKMGPEMELLAPSRLYRELYPADFSKDILQTTLNQSMVLPMEDVDWCDWACPRQISETLSRLNRHPLFPNDLAEQEYEPSSGAGDFPAEALCASSR